MKRDCKIFYLILVIFDVALVRKLYGPKPQPSDGDCPDWLFENKVIHIDSLVLQRWDRNKIVYPSLRKPTVLFFFSKKSCHGCIERVVDILSKSRNDRFETYIIAVDIDSSQERTAWDAIFLRSLPFYSLLKIRVDADRFVCLPLLLVTDNKKRVLFATSVKPFPSESETLFWDRLALLYSVTGPR